MEANNLPDTELKEMVIRILKELRTERNLEVWQHDKGLENMKKHQSEMRITKSEMKCTLEGKNSRIIKQRTKSVIWKTR